MKKAKYPKSVGREADKQTLWHSVKCGTKVVWNNPEAEGLTVLGKGSRKLVKEGVPEWMKWEPSLASHQADNESHHMQSD